VELENLAVHPKNQGIWSWGGPSVW